MSSTIGTAILLLMVSITRNPRSRRVRSFVQENTNREAQVALFIAVSP